ncbi:MAG: type II toxin-antitoxin system ParD family antitoxin [Pacificimonas sp.]|jgi:antitoxin ParD1/3/4|nr:type II toxin-antitoxin system ParD family antitoxin [Pacificimonas sp.]
MATTSVSLGPYWEKWIKDRVATGRFASATEVIRDALRRVHDEEQKLDHLRAVIKDGLDQADRGEVHENVTVDDIKALSRQIESQQAA